MLLQGLPFLALCSAWLVRAAALSRLPSGAAFLRMLAFSRQLPCSLHLPESRRTVALLVVPMVVVFELVVLARCVLEEEWRGRFGLAQYCSQITKIM